MTDRPERDAEIWLAYVKGRRQADLARDYGLTQGRISQIIQEQRALIPERTREELVQEAADFLRWSKEQALTLWHMAGAPVTAGKDGDMVYDPDTGAVVRDHSGRLAALRTAVDIDRHAAKLLGLDAAGRLEIGGSEAVAAATAALAEDAARRVAGE